MESTSRREVLAVAAATVSLPMIQAALNRMPGAMAAAPARPGTAPATQGAEVEGWFTTTLKAADVKDSEFTLVEGHAILITRSGKVISALTNKCTHKGCAIKPKAGVAKTITCACHQAQFNLDGSVAKAPAKDPLGHFAIRVNTAGLIEIDAGQKPAKDDKTYAITVA